MYLCLYHCQFFTSVFVLLKYTIQCFMWDIGRSFPYLARVLAKLLENDVILTIRSSMSVKRMILYLPISALTRIHGSKGTDTDGCSLLFWFLYCTQYVVLLYKTWWAIIRENSRYSLIDSLKFTYKKTNMWNNNSMFYLTKGDTWHDYKWDFIKENKFPATSALTLFRIS